MRVIDICGKSMVVARIDDSIQELAQTMRKHRVGTLVIVDGTGNSVRPCGIVTDRDLVVAVLARDVAPDALTAGDLMSTDLVTVDAQADPFEALSQMHSAGVRRLPVVDADDMLVGILAMDDLLGVFADALGQFKGLIAHEFEAEQRARR